MSERHTANLTIKAHIVKSGMNVRDLSKATGINIVRLFVLMASPFSRIRMTEALRIGKVLGISIGKFI